MQLLARRLLPYVSGTALVVALGQSAHALRPPPGALYDPYRSRTTVVLPVTIRDFQPSGSPGGHADFYNTAIAGTGRYADIAAYALANDDKPILSTTGHKINADWHDSSGRPIVPTRSYIDAWPGDTPGSMIGSPGGAVTSAASFAQWFRDTPGVNTSVQRTISMDYDGTASAYVFDGTFDTWTGGVPDFNYTLDMDGEFIYERGHGWFVSVGTTGDAWLYIDDKQVVDLGSGIALVAGVSGVFVNGAVTLNTSSQINPAVAGGPAPVTTLGTSSAIVSLGGSARITGNVTVGVGGDPLTAISLAPGAVITGTRTALSSPMALPPLPAIPNVGPSVGDRIYASDTTISSDLHVNNLQVNSTAKLFISGHRIIVCDSSFALIASARLEILANSSLRLFTYGFNTATGTRFNVNTSNPALATIYLYGAGPFTSSSTVGVYANAMAPAATLSISSSSWFFGNACANALSMGNGAVFMVVDTGPWGPPGGPAGPGMSGMQRIDLDRLAWLTEGRTHRLRLFFANRTGLTSRLRVESNVALLRLAALPSGNADD